MTCFYTLESSEFSSKKTQTFTHLNSRTQSSYSFTCSLPWEGDFPANRRPPLPFHNQLHTPQIYIKAIAGNRTLQPTAADYKTKTCAQKFTRARAYSPRQQRRPPMPTRRACYVLLSTMFIPPAQSCSRTNPQRHHLRKQISCIYYFKAVINGSYVTQVLVLW